MSIETYWFCYQCSRIESGGTDSMNCPKCNKSMDNTGWRETPTVLAD